MQLLEKLIIRRSEILSYCVIYLKNQSFVDWKSSLCFVLFNFCVGKGNSFYKTYDSYLY